MESNLFISNCSKKLFSVLVPLWGGKVDVGSMCSLPVQTQLLSCVLTGALLKLLTNFYYALSVYFISHVPNPGVDPSTQKKYILKILIFKYVFHFINDCLLKKKNMKTSLSGAFDIAIS